MTVINRLSRLFKADVHAMLDRIEEPPLLLQQALRDMAQALAVNERRLKLLTDEEAVLTQRHADSAAAAAEIQHELDLCLSAERDDLARGLLRQRLTGERAQAQLKPRLDPLRRQLIELRAELTTPQSELAETQRKAELISAETPTGDPGGGFNPGIRDEDIEVALLREKSRRGLR